MWPMRSTSKERRDYKRSKAMGTVKKKSREEMVNLEQPKCLWVDFRGSEYLDGKKITTFISLNCDEIEGHAVAQLVEALRYKSKYHRFHSRLSHWNSSFT